VSGVQKYVGLLLEGETYLRDSFLMVANRHEKNAEIRDGARLMAEWGDQRLAVLRGAAERHGSQTGEDPMRLRAALFHGARLGGPGLLRDLEDLNVLAQFVCGQYTALEVGAHTAKDADLEKQCLELGKEVTRTIAWVHGHLKTTAGTALAVDAEPDAKLRAAVPKTPTPAATPEAIWTPLTGGLLVLAVGLIGVLAGQPWLVPSLGPTAHLQAQVPAHPETRPYNTVVGHLTGLVAGFLSVFVCGAMNAPTVLTDHRLVLARALAAALAIALTLAVGLALHASHPPAAATTLLVALGAVKTTQDALNLMVGVLLIAALGEVARRARLRTAAPRPG
jgi:hypothetical protein